MPPTVNLSLQPEAPAPQSDKLLLELMHHVRDGVIHLLRPDQPHAPSAEDRSLGLQTLKTAADMSWRIAEKERIVAETGLRLAEVEKIRAETEKIRVQRE